MATPALASFLAIFIVSPCAWSFPEGGTTSDNHQVPDECKPAPGHHRRIDECCPFPKSKTPFEEKIKIIKECAAMLHVPLPLHLGHPPHGDHPPPPPPPNGEHPPPPPPPSGEHPPPPNGEHPHHHHHHPHLMECMAECEFNETGYLTQDMQLDGDAIKEKVLEEYGSDEQWKPVIEEAMATCLTEAPKKIKEDAKCKSGSKEFLICIRLELFQKCPSKIWKDDETCNKEKEHVKKCKDFMHVPPPPLPKDD